MNHIHCATFNLKLCYPCKNTIYQIDSEEHDCVFKWYRYDILRGEYRNDDGVYSVPDRMKNWEFLFPGESYWARKAIELFAPELLSKYDKILLLQS